MRGRPSIKREAAFDALKSLGRPADAHEIGRMIGSDYNATSGLLRLLMAAGRVQQAKGRMDGSVRLPSRWRVTPELVTRTLAEQPIPASPADAKHGQQSL